MAVKYLRKAFLTMTPQLIPVSETEEALVAGVRKTAVMRACMVFKTSSTFENLPAVTAYVLGLYRACIPPWLKASLVFK